MSIAITIAVAVVPTAAAMDPSPPPPTRRTVAWSACARLAGTAVVCLLFASMWLFFWGWAFSEVVRFAYCPTCGVLIAVYKVVKVAGVTFVVLFVSSAAALELLKRARTQAAAGVPVAAAAGVPAAAATDVERMKEPAARKKFNLTTLLRDLLREPVARAFLASASFLLVMVIAVLAIGDTTVLVSRRQRVYAVIYCVGALGMNSVNCFVLCPLLTLSIWRIWRKEGRAL